LLEAAVDIAQCPFGLDDNGASRTRFELELDAERAASRRSVHEPVEPAAGFVHQQRHCDAATG
jgi:hypothetical protein